MKKIWPTNIKMPILVDDEDYEELNQYKWHLSGKGYAYRSYKDKGVWKSELMHRRLMGEPKGMDVEHEDQNRINNQKANLRPSTRSQNMANVRKTKKATAHSQYKGVSLLKRVNKWIAYIKVDYQNIHIGYFKDEKEAAHCYNQFAEQLYGEFACINEIGGEDETDNIS